MSPITAKLLETMARTWHRFEPNGQDMNALAAMLIPMDEAGEALAERVRFDLEPSAFLLGLEAMSADRDAQ